MKKSLKISKKSNAMNKSDLDKKKNAIRPSRGFALIAVLIYWGVSLSFTYGQVVQGRQKTPTQQTTQQKTTTPLEVTVTKHTFAPVKVSATELKAINEAMATKTFTSTQTLTTAQTSAGVQPIVVTWPENNHEWQAGNEYPINWSGAQNDVKIYNRQNVLYTNIKRIVQGESLTHKPADFIYCSYRTSLNGHPIALS